MHTFARHGTRWGPYAFGPFPGAFYNQHAAGVNGTRLLYHSGLRSLRERVLQYPYLPDETVNFTDDLVVSRKVSYAATIGGHRYSKFRAVKEDSFITEVFRPESGLSATWAMLHQLNQMRLQDPDWEAGEYLLWLPRDRNHKAYAIDILELLVDGEDWKPEYRSVALRLFLDSPEGDLRDSEILEKWAITEVQLKFAIRAEAAPQANLAAYGGSETAEAGYFNVNELS